MGQRYIIAMRALGSHRKVLTAKLARLWVVSSFKPARHKGPAIIYDRGAPRGKQHFRSPPPTFSSGPPAINNDRSLIAIHYTPRLSCSQQNKGSTCSPLIEKNFPDIMFLIARCTYRINPITTKPVQFFSPPVQVAWWALLRHFLSVCLW